MISNYNQSDRMADLIEDNYRLLQVLSRFGISLGFGDKTVSQVCEMYDVDTTTFLAIINFMYSGYTQVSETPSNLSIPALLGYLRQSHLYFLEYVIPRIHRDLHKTLDSDVNNPINLLINKQFDKYISSIAKHMHYEDSTLFPYVEDLMKGVVNPKFELQTFSKHHHYMDDELRELKHILIKYTPSGTSRNELNSVLYQIYDCEEELDAHCKAEDYIFVPAIFELKERAEHAE